MIELDLFLDPVPWSAPRLSRGHVYDPKEADKRAARYLIKQQYDGPVLDCAVRVNFLFTFKVPPSFSKKKRAQALCHELVPMKSDCTNLQKLYEDCLKGIVIKDDKKVEYISSMKLYGEKGRVKIYIYPLE